MLKPVVVATAALAIAGSSIVYAQQRFGGPRLRWRSALRARTSAERRRYGGVHRRPYCRAQGRSRTDARPGEELAGVRAGLARHGATAHRSACRPVKRGSNQPQTRRRPRRSIGWRGGPTTWPRPSAALKQIADAGTPLYQSLTDAQKDAFHDAGAHVAAASSHHARNEGRAAGARWRSTAGAKARVAVALAENDGGQDRWGTTHGRHRLPDAARRQRDQGCAALSLGIAGAR